MTKPTFKSLKTEAEAIYQTYDARFAGKSRATRDLDLLDSLIERLQAVISQGRNQLNGSRDPALLSVVEMATNNLQIYQNERQAIVEAKAAGPTTHAVSRLATLANMTFARYHRHFAGKQRGTRDIGLLEDIIAVLESLREEFEAHRAEDATNVVQNVRVIDDNLEMYRSELEHILTARRAGTNNEQADRLATIANEQFKVYRDQFAGKSRPSRRPELLDRVIHQLRAVELEMVRLQKQGLSSDANRRNIDIVRQNLEMYENEAREIRKARAGLTDEQLAGTLGGAANEVMAEYREHFAGKERRTRDLDLLSKLCDQMGEICRQMNELEQTSGIEMNSKNLEIVIDTLQMYEQEYRYVEEAKAAK